MAKLQSPGGLAWIAHRDAVHCGQRLAKHIDAHQAHAAPLGYRGTNGPVSLSAVDLIRLLLFAGMRLVRLRKPAADALIHLLLFVGMRLDEGLNLRWQNVYLGGTSILQYQFSGFVAVGSALLKPSCPKGNPCASAIVIARLPKSGSGAACSWRCGASRMGYAVNPSHPN